MAVTPGGTYYAASSELVSSWPATSLNLANQLETRFASRAAYLSAATVATSQTTTSTTYADLATSGPAVTVTTGTKALVIVSASVANNTDGAYAVMSFAVSGATTLAAADTRALFVQASTGGKPAMRASVCVILTSLTAGSNTFTAKYRVTGNTGTFVDRDLTVINLGA